MEEEIRKAATRFRDAIVAHKGEISLISFQEFPLGACGDASLLLARYLHEAGMGDWEYVNGWKDGRAHAWLQQGDLIVDITADQFVESKRPVIVTENNEWHGQFQVQRRRPVDYRFRFESNHEEFETAYRTILKSLPKLEAGS